MRRVMSALLFVLGATLGPAIAPAGVEAGLLKITSVAVGSPAHDIVLDGQFAYVATDTGLTILDISNPVAPIVRGSTKIVGSGHSLGIAVKNGFVYLAAQAAGLQVVDVHNPDAPAIVSVQKPGGAIWDVAVKDTIAYAVTMNGEMYLFDIAVPTKPVKVKTIGLLAWSSAGSDDTSLAKLRALVPAGNAKITGVTVAGDSLFAVDWNYGRLYYYNVTVAGQPIFQGTHYAPFLLRVEADPARDVVYMLSAYAKTSGLYTVPISLLSPLHSTRHETCLTCGYLKAKANIDMGGLGVAPGTPYAFFAGGKALGGEVHVVDASDTDSLIDAGSTTIGAHNIKLAETMGLQSRGDILYLAAGATGVQVLMFPGLSD